MKRKLHLINSEPRLRYSRSSLSACLHAIDQCPGFELRGGSISIAFVGEDQCKQLHADFFDDPELTDVMTFPADEDDHVGDIAACPAMAAIASAEHRTAFACELTLYVVHGYLHLNGMEDATDEGRAAMRTAERQLMQFLTENGLVPDFRWDVATSAKAN